MPCLMNRKCDVFVIARSGFSHKVFFLNDTSLKNLERGGSDRISTFNNILSAVT